MFKRAIIARGKGMFRIGLITRDEVTKGILRIGLITRGKVTMGMFRIGLMARGKWEKAHA